jgi:hypothetical protein
MVGRHGGRLQAAREHPSQNSPARVHGWPQAALIGSLTAHAGLA